MTVITTVLQLLIPAKLLNSVYKVCADPLKVDSITNNNGRWLQVDLGKKTNVGGVSTQGGAHVGHWVTFYSISYSDDGTNFKPYKNNKVWNQLKNGQQKHVALRNQGHPNDTSVKYLFREARIA